MSRLIRLSVTVALPLAFVTLAACEQSPFAPPSAAQADTSCGGASQWFDAATGNCVDVVTQPVDTTVVVPTAE
jgi:hypothetical protein